MLEHQCEDGIVQDIEMWADIAGYEGRYQISSLGRVKSLSRMRRGKSGCEVPVPEIIMALQTKKVNNRTRPYVEIKLRNGGLRTEPCKSFLVHRLVAAAFIRPLVEGDEVDHINGIHGDNRVENLRILNYKDHGKLHPMLTPENVNNFIALGAIGYKAKIASGWKPGQYSRSLEFREKLAQHQRENPQPRDPITKKFIRSKNGGTANDRS